MGIKRHFGWKRQVHDPRDWMFQVPKRVTATLPTSFDLTPGMGQHFNQGQLGCCGPNTADELIQFDQKVQGLPVISASRLFIYYATRVLQGTVSSDSGVDNRTMLQALSKFGFPSEALWKYNIGKFTEQPPAAAYQAALKNAISNYAAVAVDLSTMQGTLVTGHPFMYGFDVYNQIMSDQAAANGILTMPSGSSIGGHDVSICGYNSTGGNLPGQVKGNVWPSGYFKFLNHWMNTATQRWGDGGYGYVPYGYATNANVSSDFWVINAIPSNILKPNVKLNPAAITADIQALLAAIKSGAPVTTLVADGLKILGDVIG
jgi:C1A family cysteine protease